MRQVPALINRFAKDERGVFAVLFGIMAIVLVALGGATVDYVTLEQTRARAQIALDLVQGVDVLVDDVGDLVALLDLTVAADREGSAEKDRGCCAELCFQRFPFF